MQIEGIQRRFMAVVEIWTQFYKKHKMTVTLWLLFLLSVAVRTFIFRGEKLVTTYEDEILYYGLAENLARAHSFSIYYSPYFRADRVIYPLLITPAFFAPSRAVQFLLIALINATILSSGIIPVYLLSKDVLEDKYWALFAAVLYLLMPDMAYTGTFMTDLCLLPEALWLIYLGYRIMEWKKLSTKERIRYGVSFLLVLCLASVTKQAGVLFLPTILAALLLYSYKTKKKEKKNRKLVKYLVPIGILCAIVFFMLAGRFAHISVWGWVEKTFGAIFNNPLYYLAANGYSISQMVIAGGIFPILFPYIYSKTYDEKGRRLLYFVGILTFFVLAAESYVQGLGRYSMRRIHLRYVMFLWMPYIVLFMKLLKQRFFPINRQVMIRWGMLLLWVASLIYWNKGAERGSAVDYTMLYFVEGWDSHWSIYAFILCGFVVIAFWMALHNKWRSFMVMFCSVWLIAQGYNNVMSTLVISKAYTCNAETRKDILRTEEFIKSHSDDTFLLLLVPDNANAEEPQDEVMTQDVRNVRRYADTFLNYPNVMCSAYTKYTHGENPDGSGYDIQNNPLRIYQGLGTEYTQKKVDYIIFPRNTESAIDAAKCSLVNSASGTHFLVYKMNNSDDLPNIASFRFFQTGHNYFTIDDSLFASQYYDGDKMSFVSDDGDPAYVLYAPYCTLPPGKYGVIFFVSDESGTNEKKIAVADVNSTTKQLVENPVDIYSNDEKVVLNFSSEEPIENFETRVFSLVEGVRVNAVDIVYSPFGK